MSALKIHLLIIDPQNDFVHPDGSLSVPGGADDMNRLASMVERLKDKLADIHVTLDSHRKVDISHPIWWKDSSGRHPDPFTVVTAADVADGKWTTTMPGMYQKSLAYLRALESSGRYPHVIWPEHCLIGSEGHGVWPNLFNALAEWEERFALTDYVTKGSNPWTEHFSAVKAEVPDPDDPDTQVNTRLIDTLEKADVVLLAGEALSHCMANTVRDIADEFGDPSYVQKMVLLTDASSNVAGFDQYGDDFVRDLTARGMKLDTTTDFLA